MKFTIKQKKFHSDIIILLIFFKNGYVPNLLDSFSTSLVNKEGESIIISIWIFDDAFFSENIKDAESYTSFLFTETGFSKSIPHKNYVIVFDFDKKISESVQKNAIRIVSKESEKIYFSNIRSKTK